MTRSRWRCSRWSELGLVSLFVAGCCWSAPAEAASPSSSSTRLRYRVVDDDMRLLEAQEVAMYPHRRQRKLGAIGTDADPLASLWRENYDADYGAFLVPVKFGEDDSYEGSNSMSAEDEETTKLLIETMSAKLGGVVRFVFDGDVDNARFGDRYLRVGYFESGCWSYVGRVPDAYMPQIVNLAPSCVFTDTVEHEIMHALGFYHEQSRPDRNDYVTIHWENIQVDRLSNFEIADGIDSRGVPYDRHSVMHYHSSAFSKDGSETITSTDPSDPSVGDASEMSASDVLQLRMLYRCSGSVRGAFESNCDASCPCSSEGEGKCVSDDGCALPLRCDQESGLCSSLVGGGSGGNGNGNGTGTPAPTLRPTPFPAVTRSPTSANSDVSSSEGEEGSILSTSEGKAGLTILVLLAVGILVAMFY